MPNWTTNNVTYKGDANEIKRLRETMSKDFDFNNIIPMPETLLTVSSPAQDAAVLAYVTDGFTKPVTESIAREVHKICHGDNPFFTYDDRIRLRYTKLAETLDADEMVDLSLSLDGPSEKISLKDKGKIYAENYEKYGTATWFEWAYDNWGTKWNACDVTEKASDNSVTWDFLTAWKAPFPVIAKIEQEFPDLGYEFWYTDEDDCQHSYGLRYNPLDWDDCEEE